MRHRGCNDVCDTDGVEAVHRMAHGPETVGQHGNAKDQPADCTYGNPAAGLPPYSDGERHEAHVFAVGRKHLVKGGTEHSGWAAMNSVRYISYSSYDA